MKNRPIAQYTRPELDVLRARLEHGRDVLRTGGALLQSVARGYYVVYAVASYVAGTFGVRALRVRATEHETNQRFSHNELPSLVYVLYSGEKKETIQDVGTVAGITSARFSPGAAYRKTDTLMHMRIRADYGPNAAAEPYDSSYVDELLGTANELVRDLESLL
jgi:hypothetical protein